MTIVSFLLHLGDLRCTSVTVGLDGFPSLREAEVSSAGLHHFVYHFDLLERQALKDALFTHLRY